MGIYLNPGKCGFERIIKDNYVDKTGMIRIINERIGSSDNLFCVSRPRRFGKSYAAQMLCAYYDHTCDSHGLFDDKEIAKTNHYENFINKYNIIYLDIAAFVSDLRRKTGNVKNIANEITDAIQNFLHKKLIEIYPL